MRNMTWLFLVEEVRLRRSFSSSLSLIIFPEIILLGAMGGYVFLPMMEDTFTYAQIHTAVLGSLFMFGVSMGGIAFLGKEFIERTLGPVTMLAASMNYHPVNEKRMYLSYYLHDLIFYIVLVLAPITTGLLLGMIVEPMPLERFLIISVSQWSTFLLGLSLTMFVSSLVNNPRRILLLLIPVSIMPMVSSQVITGEVRAFIPGIMAVEGEPLLWLSLGLLLTVVYVSLGVTTFEGGQRGNRNSATGSYDEYVRFSAFFYPVDHVSRTLLARELLGLVRGKAYIRIGFSILFPLLVMAGLIGVISGLEGIPVSFNLTFFAVMVSFFTISIYTHLTNIDFLDFDQTMPVSTPDLIKVKIRLFMILSIPISVLFLVFISAAMRDPAGLIFGIPLVLVAVPYMGYVTAYLTGLWTNSLIFDSSVFIKYSLFTVLPLMVATILSFLMTDMLLPAIAGITIVILMGAVAVFILSRALEKRWNDTVLSSSGQGFLEGGNA